MSTRLKRRSNSSVVTIETGAPVRSTREGIFYPVGGSPGLLAKIYRQDGNDHIPKLVAMLDNPPEDPSVAQGHVSIAWPMDLLYTSDMRDCVGFVTLRPPVAQPLSIVYNPISRRREGPLFTYRYLCRAAQNLAGAIEALHQKGYVLGDINDHSALVTDTALITLVDTDTYQVFDPKKMTTHRCLTGRSEFTAPELQRKDFAEIDREPAQDNFALAVLVFLLLMEGDHPFSSGIVNSADDDGYRERIEGGQFIFGRGADASPARKSRLPFSILPLVIRDLFTRAFEDGHASPMMRPSAAEWRSALQEMESRMVACTNNAQHLYPSHLTACLRCERVAQLGITDPFPSREFIEFAQTPKRDAVQAPLPSATRPLSTGAAVSTATRPAVSLDPTRSVASSAGAYLPPVSTTRAARANWLGPRKQEAG
jgi:DNA-binding helix-hairpin-helix protein with protein kinase domain